MTHPFQSRKWLAATFLAALFASLPTLSHALEIDADSELTVSSNHELVRVDRHRIFVKLKKGKRFPRSEHVISATRLFGRLFVVQTGNADALRQELADKGLIEYTERNTYHGKQALPEPVEHQAVENTTDAASFNDPLVGKIWSFADDSGNGISVNKAYTLAATSSKKEVIVAVVDTGVTGVCGSGIIEALAEMYLAGIIRHEGTIDGNLAARSPRVQPDGRTFCYELAPATAEKPALRILQNDVRAIQLGKAALYAGVRLLMERMGVQKVDRIRLAGAFGSHIDVKYAMVLGMIPDCILGNVSSAGNAAGTGARIALLDKGSRKVIEDLVRRVEKIETAVEPRFQEFFVEAMAIPHLTDPFERLQDVVTLPERLAVATEQNARSRRGPRRA